MYCRNILQIVRYLQNNIVEFSCKYCAYFVKILYKNCTNIVQIMHDLKKCCCNTVHILSIYCMNIVQILSKYCTQIVHKLYKYYENMHFKFCGNIVKKKSVQILYIHCTDIVKYCSYSVQILDEKCTKMMCVYCTSTV